LKEACMSAETVELVKDALKGDDAKSLREVLARHPELRARVNEPICPFDSPAINWVRSRAMLDVLLEAGADINARSRWWAGGFGILDSVEPDLAAYAIERGATVDVHAATRLGMFERLRELVTANPELVHARGGDGQTPLHVASTVKIAQFLLENGAEIDARDVDHESTPAQYLVRDHQDVARFLVGRGCETDILMAAALGDIDLVRKHLDADPDAIRMSVCEHYFPKQNPRSGGTIYFWKLGHNKTAHVIAREFGHQDVFRLLMERSPVELKLSQACLLGDEETFHALLASDPELPRRLSEDDRRKLADAAENNNADAVRLMLAAGWPVDARGQHGGMALHWAAWHGNAKIVREVLRYKPPIDDAQNEFAATPLGWAVHGSEHGWHRKSGDYASVVEMLCEAGAAVPEEPAGTERVKAVLRRYQERRENPK
jgi:ankyrin repeat protein